MSRSRIFSKNLFDAEIGQRGYLLTARGGYLNPFKSASANISHEFEQLLQMNRDNPVQVETLSRLEVQMNRHFNLMARTIDLKKREMTQKPSASC